MSLMLKLKGWEVITLNDIIIGSVFRCETEVTKENTAKTAKSGTLDVFATPSMLALMESAASECLKRFLDDGETSVGTAVNIVHTSATPVGMKVWAEAEITKAEGRKISFKVTAFDECGEIGKGTHERFIINSKKFLEKANAKEAEK